MPYIGNSPGTGTRNRYIYTATASQTTFSGADDNGKTLAYSDGDYVDVYLNGICLVPVDDYAATSKTSIVLTVGAAASDTLEVVAYDIATIADTVSKANGGNFEAGINIDGNVGIGTSSPSTNLEIVGSVANRARLQTTSTECNLQFWNDSTPSFAASIGTGNPTSNLSGTDGLKFDIYNGSSWSERMRIDSSGNLLVGKTTSAITGVGVVLNQNGVIKGTVDGSRAGHFNRINSDGEIVRLDKDGTTVGSIGTHASGRSYIAMGTNASRGWSSDNSVLYPCDGSGAGLDNLVDLGRVDIRFDDIYATNGTIQTSDQNEKQQIASLTDAEIIAAKAISKLFKTFKWNDSVAEKGDAARTHTGVIAQEVEQAMTDAGLNAGDYAFFISTTWWETQTEVPAVEAVEAVEATYDEEGNVLTEAVEAVEAREAYTRTDTYDTAEEAPEGATERNRKGIRYPQLLSFIGAATEQRLASVESRLDALEAN